MEDDVAPLAARRFLFRELARLHQALHQRLVLGELHRLAVADQVGAAISYLREVDVIVEDADGRGGGAHAPHLGVRFGVRVNLPVGGLDGFLQPVCEPLRRRFLLTSPQPDHLVIDGVRGHLAGELARGGAAHAVGDDQQRPPLTHVVRAHRRLQRRLAAGEIGHEETVLVVVARLAEVGLGEDLDLDGLGGAPEHQGDKSPFSSLTSFWYVVLSGASTKAAWHHCRALERAFSLMYESQMILAAAARYTFGSAVIA